MPELQLSVIIPSRDGRELLAACLPPLLADLEALGEAEVIVVDDHSSDDSLSFLREAFPKIRIVALNATSGSTGAAGFAAACNAGAHIARAPTLAFLNNDAEVRLGWSAALLAALDADAHAAIAGGLTLFRTFPPTVNSAGVLVGHSGSAADIGLGARLSAVNLAPRAVAAVSGVSMAARADWFGATGGFEEQLFMYFEDVELCVRAWREGRSVRFTPESVVLHRGAATAGQRQDRLRSYYGSRNRLLVAALCLDRSDLPRAVAVLLAQDLAAVASLAARGQLRAAVMTSRGRARGAGDGLRSLRAARQRRLAKKRYVRDFAELHELGLIAGLGATLREFARLQRLR